MFEGFNFVTVTDVKRAFPVIGILLIIFGIVAFFYFKNQNTFSLTDADPTTPLPAETTSTISPTSPVPVIPEEWEAFNSVKYDFVIRYPSDVNHDTTAEGERFFKTGPTQSLGTELYDGISVTIYSEGLGDDTFDTFVQSKFKEMRNDPVNSQVSEIRKITIAGKNGYAFDVQSLGDSTHMFLPKENDEYLAIVDGTVEPTNRKQIYRTIVDRMLSSILLK